MPPASQSASPLPGLLLLLFALLTAAGSDGVASAVMGSPPVATAPVASASMPSAGCGGSAATAAWAASKGAESIG